MQSNSLAELKGQWDEVASASRQMQDRLSEWRDALHERQQAVAEQSQQIEADRSSMRGHEERLENEFARLRTEIEGQQQELEDSRNRFDTQLSQDREEDGPSATEYAILLALLIIGAMATIGAIGSSMDDIYVTINAAVVGAGM